MPITQERLHSILEAGLDLWTEIQELQEMFTIFADEIRQGTNTTDKAFDELFIRIRTIGSLDSVVLLKQEEVIYERTHKANVRQRFRQDQRRRRRGIKPRMSAEQKLARELELTDNVPDEVLAEPKRPAIDPFAPIPDNIYHRPRGPDGLPIEKPEELKDYERHVAQRKPEFKI